MELSLLKDLLIQSGADPVLTLQLLEQVNRGDFHSSPVLPSDFPAPDGKSVLDMTAPVPPFPEPSIRENFSRFFPEESPEKYGDFHQGFFHTDMEKLTLLGLKLLGKTAVGILNGGSATSYGDEKKNRSYGEKIFEIYRDNLRAQSRDYEGQPKGISPAFLHPDGTPGPSFMELKIRALMIQSLCHLWATGEKAVPALFQMTSGGTDGPISQAINSYRDSPLLAPLFQEAGWETLEVHTGIQGLIGTFTPKNPQGLRSVFTWDSPEGPKALALPGGHGQNFRVLQNVYADLQKRGFSFAYLGNVDNLGFLMDPPSVALLALTGASAGFDFSFKTSVDVKGGLLYRDPAGKLNCGDLGVAIPGDEVKKAEAEGKGPLLFNCATGLFNLEYLNIHLEEIIRKLPLRLSEQDKDIGRYAQVEQVTWEVLGLLESPLIFAVEKRRRFLAAKLLIESYLTSGWKLDDPRFTDPELKEMKELATGLNQGLNNLLSGPYGMKLEGPRWVPLSIRELRQRFEKRGLADLRP